MSGRRASPKEEKDRISSLLDEVLCHILSFLPTKEAVVTSAVSKRWYPLWRSVTELDLSDEFVPQDDQNAYLRYKEFVLSVLLLRDTTQPIKRFALKQHRDDYPNLNKWVSVALKRGVESLKLLCNTDVYHKLPAGIFTCRTLVALDLETFLVNDISSVELPLLKILHLKKFQFTKYQLLPELLSRCPNLEEFYAIRLRYVNNDSNGNFTSLKKLTKAVIVDDDFNIPLEAFDNVGCLNLNMPEVPPIYNHMPVFINLTQIRLSFYEYRWKWLVELLNHCPKLQALNIRQKRFRSNTAENWVSPRLVPECVSLHLRECTIIDYWGIMEGELRFARYILQNANVLRTMTIHSTIHSDFDEKLQMVEDLTMSLSSPAACKVIVK